MFDNLIWKQDRMLLDDLVFRLELGKDDQWELGDQCFVLYKDKKLLDQYARYFMTKPELAVDNIIELGIYDGGSLAFWSEYFHPKKLVGIDILNRKDSAYFSEYVKSRHLEGIIQTHWEVDQGDPNRLRQIVRKEFDSSIDIVIDDASHQYKLTKTSFETLFPMMHPGSLYFIEDWAWGHWQAWQAEDHPWAGNIALTRLIFDFVEAAGTSTDLISSVAVFQGFTVVERGPAKLDPWTSLNLEAHILRRARHPAGNM